MVGFAMFTFVLPKLTATFKEFNAELPMTTKLVINATDFFSKYGLFAFIGMIVMVIAFNRWRKTEAGRQIVHKIINRIFRLLLFGFRGQGGFLLFWRIELEFWLLFRRWLFRLFRLLWFWCRFFGSRLRAGYNWVNRK